ncbi:MAG: orotate phosphoribosyltransferase-like protein [Methanoregula sp.]|jgi:orotate phosphoribosyltransferase
MSSLDDLIARAKMLLSEGHSPGQIADELSLSMETVTWLLTQAKGTAVPKDVHIDWTVVSSQAPLLDEIALMLLNRYYSARKDNCPDGSPVADVIIGVALSGIPLATMIAVQEAVQLAVYNPSKQNASDHPVGSISGNFASVSGQKCIIVDDVITSGNTMHEVIKYLKKHGASPVAVWVIFDKRGIKEIEGVPVYSLFKISRID